MKVVIALAIAAVWSAALLIAAVTVPVYRSTSVSSSTYASTAADPMSPQEVVTTGSATLVGENGAQVLFVVGIPAFVVILVGLALVRRQAKAKPGAGPFAWTVVALLGAFTLVAMLSIGIVVVPVTASLLFACASA